jgi:tetratricopeptide (TPR) repeat protein
MALAMGFFPPLASAQKRPPPPPPSTPVQPATPSPSQPTPPVVPEDLVLLLHGRIATNDGTPLPNNALVERICKNQVRQQVYASSHGDFTMQMGSNSNSFVDATGRADSDSASQQTPAAKRASMEGIPRRDLMDCELKATVGGFRSNSISLAELTPSDRSIDVGAIVVERVAKIKGMTLDARPYKAPPNARKAYEKGLEAESSGKLFEARKYFEQALDLYPQHAAAWFQLGKIFEKQNQSDSARAAYTKSTSLDMKFVPPRLALAAMAYEAKNWTELLQLTAYIIDRDFLNHGDVAGYLLDLDEVNPAEAYFFNAVANYKLNKTEEAEKSARKAEHVDLRHNFPQLHVLLAKILAGKKNYAVAISELHTYLAFVPHPKDEDEVRQYLAGLEELNRAAQNSEKPVQN